MCIAPRAAVSCLLPLLLTCAGGSPGSAGAPRRADGRGEEAQERARPGAVPRIDLPPLPLLQRIESGFLPEDLSRIHRLRGFIAGDLFPARYGGLPAATRIDVIYLAAVKIAEGDPIQALLISCFATLPYRTFDAIVPLAQWVITLPVSTESREEFRRRLRNLPAGFLPDSPPRGDQDKLPHFFGSAYIACVTKSSAYGERAGIWVETLESVFKLEGFSDERDIRAGEHGIDFGRALLAHRNALPSEFLPRTSTINRR